MDYSLGRDRDEGLYSDGHVDLIWFWDAFESCRWTRYWFGILRSHARRSSLCTWGGTGWSRLRSRCLLTWLVILFLHSRLWWSYHWSRLLRLGYSGARDTSWVPWLRLCVLRRMSSIACSSYPKWAIDYHLLLRLVIDSATWVHRLLVCAIRICWRCCDCVLLDHDCRWSYPYRNWTRDPTYWILLRLSTNDLHVLVMTNCFLQSKLLMVCYVLISMIFREASSNPTASWFFDNQCTDVTIAPD